MIQCLCISEKLWGEKSLISGLRIKFSALVASIFSVFLSFEPSCSNVPCVVCATDNLVKSSTTSDTGSSWNASSGTRYLLHGALAIICLCTFGLYKYFANNNCNKVSIDTDFVRNYIVVGLNKSKGVNDRENVIAFFAKAFNEAGICRFTVSDAQGFWRNRFNLKKPLQMPLNLNPSLVFFVDGPKEQTSKIASVVKNFLDPKNGYDQSCVLHTVEPLLNSKLIYFDRMEKLY